MAKCVPTWQLVKGDLEGSSLDYFVPVRYPKHIVFSQFSAQRKEDRTIGNVGFGVRQNVGAWLLGSNVFYDYDFTRGHRRLGLGGEAWTDFLRFSGNYYHPLSDWKDSEDFEFYENVRLKAGTCGQRRGYHSIRSLAAN